MQLISVLEPDPVAEQQLLPDVLAEPPFEAGALQAAFELSAVPKLPMGANGPRRLVPDDVDVEPGHVVTGLEGAWHSRPAQIMTLTSSM